MSGLVTPKITVEVVTPQMAAQMLGTMAGNRRLRVRVVQRYAREMVAGKWLLNGESIKVDRSGRLIDGQHRLNAILMAKVGVQMCVVRGVDESAMITLDTGVGRSFYDVGVIAGKPYAQAVGPIARWWHKYESGSPTVQYVPTHQEMDAMIAKHPSISESAGFVARLKIVHSRCVPSVQGFVHAYTSEKYDREMADSFMQDLNDGASLAATSPIFVLRRRLVDENGKGRLESAHVLALTIKAWNAWIDGSKLKNLVWRTGGAVPEEFPRFNADRPTPKVYRMRLARQA